MKPSSFDTKRILLIAAGCVALTQIGAFLKGSAWLIGAPEAAYAGKQTAEETKVRFDTLIDHLDTYSKAMQQHPQAPVSPPEELSDNGEVKEMRWVDEQGVKHHLCCNGTECWTWRKRAQCERE